MGYGRSLKEIQKAHKPVVEQKVAKAAKADKKPAAKKPADKKAKK